MSDHHEVESSAPFEGFRPTRVLYVSHSAVLSGAEQNLLRLLTVLDRKAVEPVVVLPRDGPLRAEIDALSIETKTSPLAWWFPATHWNRDRFLAQLDGLEERIDGVRKILEVGGFDLVHTNTTVTLEGAVAAARVGLPHVWHNRGLFGPGLPPDYFFGPEYIFSVIDLLADIVVCMAESVEKQTRQHCRLADLELVYDGIDFDRYENPPTDMVRSFRDEHGFPKDGRVILCLGGIQERKAQLDLVEAAPEVVRRHPQVVFLIVGSAEDKYAARVVERVAALGLTENFRILPFQPDPRAAIHSSDLLVHPAHFEAFGLVVLEAMASGKPVVAARSGGPEEMIVDGQTGYLVELRNPEALASAILRVLDDPAAAASLGAAGRERARGFSRERTAARIEEMYRRLIHDRVDFPEAARRVRARVADFVVEDFAGRFSAE
jgi:glycosyltransferase involved in cell wall biosynthesis